MNDATNKINALLNLFTNRNNLVVSVDKAREIVRVMNAAAGESTRSDFFDFHGFFLTVEGVGTLRVVVPKDARRAARLGAVVAFNEAAPGELAFYLDAVADAAAELRAAPSSTTSPERAATLAFLRSEIARIEAKTSAPAAPAAPAPESVPAAPRRRVRRMNDRDRLELHIQARALAARPVQLPRGRGYRSC